MRLVQLIDTKINSAYGEEKKILCQLDKMFSAYTFKREDCEEFKVALAEVCINAIEHGNRENTRLPVHVSVQLNENVITCTVCDKGKGFCPDDKSDLDRGHGLKIVQHFVDHLTMYHTYEQERLFCVELIKRLRVQKGGRC